MSQGVLSSSNPATTSQGTSEGLECLSAKCSIPFGSRVSDLRLEAKVTYDKELIAGRSQPSRIIDESRKGLCEAGLKYTAEYFRSVTGNDDFFKAHVSQILGWVLTELTVNELYHGILGFDSRDKCALTAAASEYEALYGNKVDPEKKRSELEYQLAERVTIAGASRPLSVSIRTGSDDEGHSYIEISVGAPRTFDLEKARQAAKEESARVDTLFEEGKIEEATAILEKRWGRGILAMDGKLTSPGDSLRQEPPLTGPVIFRKRLPDK